MDKDRNGTLSRDELENMMDSKMRKKFKMNWDEFMDAVDQNQDGMVDI